MTKTCPDCLLLNCPTGQPWDLGVHCPKTMQFKLDSSGYTDAALCELECLRIGYDKLKAEKARAVSMLRGALVELDGVNEQEALGG